MISHDDRKVYLASSAEKEYRIKPGCDIPELPNREATTAILTLRELFRSAKLDRDSEGTSKWNPLGDLIGQGKRVLLKPNWVYHENRTGHEIDCLLTHSSLIDAVLAYVQKTNPAEVILGDAPMQSCDFSALLKNCNINEVVARYREDGMPVTIRDFRKKIMSSEKCVNESSRSDEDFYLFDLKEKSALEPVTRENGSRFRVTCYDPDAVSKTHQKGKHQYLVAREVIDCDVIINMPKLKSHKKAGVTGALKNLVGINGLKDYLPHHRKGGTDVGGDCYQGHNIFAQRIENLFDKCNSNPKRSRLTETYRHVCSRVLHRLARFWGYEQFEGSWKGNDTIWRTCLDLQKIALYGRDDGTLAKKPQRNMIHITDAIIAGEGEGPLSPSPKPLGMLTLGTNPAAIEWVHALLMKMDPLSIPLIREAMLNERFALSDFSPESIQPIVDGHMVSTDDISEKYGQKFMIPKGWE